MAVERRGLDDFNHVPTRETETKRHSWIPRNLIELAQNPPAPPAIGGMLYPGKRTLLSGETESLKTWLALILAKAEILYEQTVAWVDLDDMGAGAILQRLRTLGLSDEQISTFFLYYQPDQRLYDIKEQRRVEILDEVLAQLAVAGTRLMVIDAFNPMLSLHGFDPSSTPDIETFWREIADPIARTGTAPVLLDHVAKNADSRGKYSYGSERKASGATVHIGAHALEALTIGGEGRAVLTTHKDRPAYLPRPTIGVLRLVSHLDGDSETIAYSLDADQSHAGGGFRPTVLMERISRQLETHVEPVSQNWVEKNVTGNVKALRTALKTLIDGGYVMPTTHLSLMPYREENDPIIEAAEGASSVRPNRVPELVSTGCVPASHPLGGTQVDAPTDAARTRSSSSNGTRGLFDDTEPSEDEHEVIHADAEPRIAGRTGESGF